MRRKGLLASQSVKLLDVNYVVTS